MYRCFQNLRTNRYCVQSADFIELPFDEEQFKQLDVDFIEHFCEEAPDQRADSYDDLSEAIRKHDLDFEE